jgi:hypothetical protein
VFFTERWRGADAIPNWDKIAETAMASRIAAHIERGSELKRRYIELVSSWQYDPKTDRFPEFITGEPHSLGDLEIEVERGSMSRNSSREAC